MMIYGTQLVGIQSVIAGQGMYRRTLNLTGRSQRVRRTPEPRHPQAPVLDESDRREDEFRTAAPRTSESASRLGVLLTY